MIEAILFAVTLVAARIVLAPLLRRLPAPAWYRRLRARHRPGVPVVTVAGTVFLMGVVWVIGARQGVAGYVLLALWVLTPLAAWEILRSWWRRDRPSR